MKSKDSYIDTSPKTQNLQRLNSNNFDTEDITHNISQAHSTKTSKFMNKNKLKDVTETQKQ